MEPTATSSLGPASRAAALQALGAQVLDVLVVGAGATGAGTALDAASRGLNVGLIDKGDIAGGTSSRSSKLVHGGLRYLQQGNVALVREALRERDLLLTTLAPHLVTPLAFMVPLHHRVWERGYVGAGLLTYDLLAGSSVLPRHRHLTKRSALARFPGMRPGSLVGALQYFDAQMDDARLAVAVARTAAQHGAHVATRVTLVRPAADRGDGLHRVLVRDELTGQEIAVTARCIALCVGVWAPEVSACFTGTDDAVGITRSKGVHIRLPRTAIDGEVALTIPSGKSVLFVIPSKSHWLVGTTDTQWMDEPDGVQPNVEDVGYLLGLLAGVLANPVTTADVTYAFAGLRPLVRDQTVGGNTAKVSREHRIARVAPGVLAIVGGKWTTYRVMARDLVDTVLEESGMPPRACSTQEIPLVGSSVLTSAPTPAALSLTRDERAALDTRYGSRVGEVFSIMTAQPELMSPLSGAEGFWLAEVANACVNEGALLLDDVLDRRLRLGLNLDAVTSGTVQAAARTMGTTIGWDEATSLDAAADYETSHVPLWMSSASMMR